MRILFVKILCALLCIPAYPIVVPVMWLDRTRYLGNTATFRSLSVDYWEDVWSTLTYRKEVRG